MKLAYIAGPYRAKTKLGIQLNRQMAKIASRKFLELGYIPFVPHNMFLFDEENETQEEMMKICFEAIKRCDVVVLLPGWTESEGSVEESTYADDLGIEIIDLEFPHTDLSDKLSNLAYQLQEIKTAFDEIATIE